MPLKQFLNVRLSYILPLCTICFLYNATMITEIKNYSWPDSLQRPFIGTMVTTETSAACSSSQLRVLRKQAWPTDRQLTDAWTAGLVPSCLRHFAEMADYWAGLFWPCLFLEVEFHTVAKAGLTLHASLPASDFHILGSEQTPYTQFCSAFLLKHLFHMCMCVYRHSHHGKDVESRTTFGICSSATWVPGPPSGLEASSFTCLAAPLALV